MGHASRKYTYHGMNGHADLSLRKSSIILANIRTTGSRCSSFDSQKQDRTHQEFAVQESPKSLMRLHILLSVIAPGINRYTLTPALSRIAVGFQYTTQYTSLSLWSVRVLVHESWIGGSEVLKEGRGYAAVC